MSFFGGFFDLEKPSNKQLLNSARTVGECKYTVADLNKQVVQRCASKYFPKTMNLFVAKKQQYKSGLAKLRTDEVHRLEQFLLNFKGLLFDFSRVAIDRKAFDQLPELADQSGLAADLEWMFAGEAIKNTEDTPRIASFMSH